MFTKELSTKLLNIIDERNMTLESLSEAAGLSRKFIGNVTSGKQVPTLSSFERICSALELEPNDLLINSKSKTADKSKPMRVDTVYCQRKDNVYSYIPVCPRCNSLLDNDWQSYCDTCGQKLSWKRYIDSKVVTDKPPKKQF